MVVKRVNTADTSCFLVCCVSGCLAIIRDIFYFCCLMTKSLLYTSIQYNLCSFTSLVDKINNSVLAPELCSAPTL